MTDRIPCAVPFCNRTIKPDQPRDPDQRAICRHHARAISKGTKRLYRKFSKRLDELQDQYPNPEEAPASVRAEFLRLWNVCSWLWERGKSQVIRAAGGWR